MSEETPVTTSDSDREEVNSVIPTDPDLIAKIVELVEFYFSDENVLKDRFLHKHIKRNREGYVSIKLMTSYRKVKTLTKNWQIVAQSLKISRKLEVNEEGTRVRRREPLPEIEESIRSKCVLAYKLPFEKTTVEKVCKLFSCCGDIALVQILRVGGNIPDDIRKLCCKQPDILGEVCALIEFEQESSTQRALEIKKARVISLRQSENCKNKRKKPKSKPKNIVIKDYEKYSGCRSSSASSGYLSSSPRRASDCDSRCSSPGLVINRRYTLPNVVQQGKREHRLELISEQKISNYILRLPKGPDQTSKGFGSRKIPIRGSI